MKLIEQLVSRHPTASANPLDFGIRFGAAKEIRAEEEAGQGGRMLITAVATTSGVDLENEVVVPSGCDPSYFQAAGAIYWGHQTFDLPVAALRNIQVLPNDSGIRVQMSTLSTEFSRDVAIAVAEGAVRGTSIGFLRTDSGQPTPAEVNTYGPHEFITRRWKWIELSLTSMPCNPEAMIESVGPAKALGEAAERIGQLVAKGRISKASGERMGYVKARTVVAVKPRTTLRLTRA